ncbi:MAG: hypothetical protein ACPGR2_05535 [Psychrobium sp.]
MSIYILTPELFIKQKAQQLVYVVNQLMKQAIPFSEVHIIVWDILEEWNRLDKEDSDELSDFERVFWHLFYTIQFETECDLANNKHLRLAIDKCCKYLQQPDLPAPAGCVGVRP